MSIWDELAAPFPKEKVSWRAQSLTKDGDKALALAYLDARDIRSRLNQVVGHANWTCEHYDCGAGKLGCKLSIRVDGEWITKTDGAGDTQVEAEKGAFSGALKRSAVAFGIGEYLYDMPATWVPCTHYESNGKKHWKAWTADPWSFVRGFDTPKPPQQEKPVEVKTLGKNEEARALFQSLREDMIQAQSLPDLKARWIAIQDDLKKLPADWRKDVEDLKDSVKADLDKNGAPPQGFKSAQASLDGLPQDKYTPADYLRAGE